MNQHFLPKPSWMGLHLFSILFFYTSCQTNEKPTTYRPHEPWVIRSVLDSLPRVATIALHDDLWVAYHTENGSLYKAWKGSVNFDGAVYTTVHGPQPSSIGDAWMVNRHQQPWRIVRNGKEETPKVQYRGHRFEQGQVWLNYELYLPEGEKILVSERPEYFSSENGLTGFERTFRTGHVPNGVEVVLLLNLNSVAFEQSIQTDGHWKLISKQPVMRGKYHGYEMEGRLTLPANASCRFATTFTAVPFVKNENRIAGDEAAENIPLGLRLIDRNDCKTCHNTFVATVGPSYLDVARRYRNNSANVEMLVAKVKNGGSGNWGQAAMTPHLDLPDNDLRTMVAYIMSLDAEEEAQLAEIPETTVPIVMKESLPEADESEFMPGAVVKVYQYDRNLTQLADLKPFPKPIYEGVVPTLHATAEEFGDLTDNFGLVAEGYLKIPKDNNYLLRLVSDDGSKLWIDGELLIDHDGLHGDSPKDAEIGLKAGFHSFRLEYFEAGGGNVVSLQWRSFDNKKGMEIVPPQVIWHKKDETPTASVAASLGGGSRLPGDRTAVAGVHPSYDLWQARPNDFFPKVGGMDFLSDGRLVVSRWDPEGGVYILEGVQTGDPSKMSAKRIAAGLHEPLGLKVVDDTIFVLQKQELTKLIDLDGDEVIDEYYTLCNNWGVSTNFHEFAFGLVYKDGYFYGSLATDILPGGAGAPVQPKDRGRTFKISRADGSIQLITSGLRTPNGIGIGVDGEIFNADNQGDWLPSSKIVHITEGAFYGSRAVDYEGTANLPVKQPVVWLPQDEIGNSPSTPLALNDGPYKGQMIHGEVTHGGVKRVFVEKINGQYQGCVFRFIQGLEAGINRMVWGPDSALYIGGIGNPGNWQHGQNRWFGLQRLKYNGKPTFEMLAVRAKTNGMEIEFTQPLEPRIGWEPSEYTVQQWRYVPTANYGGPKVDLTRLPVSSASVSADRRKVFLQIDGLKAGHVVYIRIPNYWISENGLELWSTEAWYTLNAIPEGNFGTVLTKPVFRPNTLSDEEKASGWRLLFDGNTLNGWRNYNKKSIGKSWIIDDDAIHLNALRKSNGGWQAEDGGDILYDEIFENYELRLEWKIAPCGNSGIIYNIVENNQYEYPWQTGPEMQVLDNACHPDAFVETHKAGDLYDLISSKYITVKPAGQWNEVRIINRKGKVEHWLNGRKVVEVDMTSGQWLQLINNSKFKDMPGFGRSTKGYIALQDHGDKVWYRNIRIRSLN